MRDIYLELKKKGIYSTVSVLRSKVMIVCSLLEPFLFDLEMK